MNTLTLGIESAIGGGSLSLLGGADEIDSWTGTGNLSQAEDLLPNIVEMLDRQGIDRHQISQIAVSTGPGSFTGIRIGIATALGLKDSLNIPCIGVSALEAIAASTTGRVIAAVPVGRDLICSQAFDVTPREVRVISLPLVDKTLVAAAGAHVIAHDSIAKRLAATPCGQDLARLIALAATRGRGSRTIEPMFLQPVS